MAQIAPEYLSAVSTIIHRVNRELTINIWRKQINLTYPLNYILLSAVSSGNDITKKGEYFHYLNGRLFIFQKIGFQVYPE